MLRKFHGTFEDLQEVVKKTGLEGAWQYDGSMQNFRTLDGGVLNWWSNGTIQFQGKPDAKALLEGSLNLGNCRPRSTSPPVDDMPDTFVRHNQHGQHGKPVRVRKGLSLLERLKEALTAAGLTVNQISRSTCIVNTPNSDQYCSVVLRGE